MFQEEYMGKALQVAEGVINALKNGNPMAAKPLLSADFQFIDTDSGRTLTADEWLGSNHMMRAAFPDLSYNFEILEEKDNQVWVRNNFEGTNTSDWDLSGMGMDVLPATGKRVSTGYTVTVGTVNSDGKVTSIEVIESEPGSGIMGVMQQLGVSMG
jgi:predicted ester cyclase